MSNQSPKLPPGGDDSDEDDEKNPIQKLIASWETEGRDKQIQRLEKMMNTGTGNYE